MRSLVHSVLLLLLNYIILSINQNFKPAVRSSKDEVEKCFEKCGDKDADDADKINECQAECVDDEVSNGRSRSTIGPRGKHIIQRV